MFRMCRGNEEALEGINANLRAYGTFGCFWCRFNVFDQAVNTLQRLTVNKQREITWSLLATMSV